MAMERTGDGSAGDADYARIGFGYADYRRPDPRIAAAILRELGDAYTVLNVGAGAGSYEPRDRDVTAVEPSATMRIQREAGLPRAIDATAEQPAVRRRRLRRLARHLHRAPVGRHRPRPRRDATRDARTGAGAQLRPEGARQVLARRVRPRGHRHRGRAIPRGRAHRRGAGREQPHHRRADPARLPRRLRRGLLRPPRGAARPRRTTGELGVELRRPARGAPFRARARRRAGLRRLGRQVRRPAHPARVRGLAAAHRRAASRAAQLRPRTSSGPQRAT